MGGGITVTSSGAMSIAVVPDDGVSKLAPQLGQKWALLLASCPHLGQLMVCDGLTLVSRLSESSGI